MKELAPAKDYADPLTLLKPTTPKYAIWIAEDVAIYTRFGRPNWFRRFWLWAFFGWTWAPIEQVEVAGDE